MFVVVEISSDCDEAAQWQVPFNIYYILLLLLQFLGHFLSRWPSDKSATTKQLMVMGGQALLSTLNLWSLSYVRAKPFKCFHNEFDPTLARFAFMGSMIVTLIISILTASSQATQRNRKGPSSELAKSPTANPGVTNPAAETST